tara:strand:- start:146 stop:343 length:198 start_codon:yes stop_codon:yes gene_type:complete
MKNQGYLAELAVESIEQELRDQLEDVIDLVIDNSDPFDELSCKTQQMLKEGLLREIKLTVELYED